MPLVRRRSAATSPPRGAMGVRSSGRRSGRPVPPACRGEICVRVLAIRDPSSLRSSRSWRRGSPPAAQAGRRWRQGSTRLALRRGSAAPRRSRPPVRSPAVSYAWIAAVLSARTLSAITSIPSSSRLRLRSAQAAVASPRPRASGRVATFPSAATRHSGDQTWTPATQTSPSASRIPTYRRVSSIRGSNHVPGYARS